MNINMYTNAALYYLNQMGIIPWIAQDRDSNTQIIEEVAPQLVVFLPANQSPKAQTLLKRLLHFIGLAEDEVKIIHKANLQLDDFKTLDKPSPLAVLVLGFKPIHIHLTCPVFICDDPEFLLLNPYCKKKVFQELLRIKNQLASYQLVS